MGKAAQDWADFQEPMHEPLWTAMLNAGKVGKGTRVCDVGCGGGGASMLAADRRAVISGIDAAETLVEIARERIPRGNFRVGDMQHLPFADASFDTVIAANSLQYSEDRLDTLREFKRVCVQDGKIVIGLWGPAEKVSFRVFFKAVKEALPVPPPGKGPFELSAPGALANLIEDTGMKVVGSDEVECPFAYSNFKELWQANKSAGPLQAAIKQVSSSVLSRKIRSALSAFEKADGSILFENTFQYVVAVP
ncbi:MAG TPA: class I SAM-dependent methyltransferase [Balneolaceae bacterium]|nr:class I SAM-dependent methyltransferase [Balneolaceae bacterium]